MSTETPLTEYEQLQAHAALVARRILRTGENFSPHDIEQLARAWSLQAGEEIRANERLAAAQSTIAEQAEEIERLRDGLSGLLGLFHLLYERDDAPPWLREIALTNHRAQLARRLLMEPSNADRL